MPHANPASVLKVLRDSGEQTLASLSALVDRPAWPKTSRIVGETFVGPCVVGLASAGLITLHEADGSPAVRKPVTEEQLLFLSAYPPASLVVSLDARWAHIQEVLQISLTELDLKAQGESMLVSPVFGPCKGRHGSPNVFVVMPFAEEMKAVFEAIRSVVLACGLGVSRGDDLSRPGVVVEQLWFSICSARFIVADCSDRNSNVFYEIGLADAIGTPVIFLTQDVKTLPFDIQHRRVIQYSRGADGISQLKSALDATIRAELPSTP
jgi:hypothetical protein